ncbi:unnamed protein product [Owenia fusiformis]|uniref:Uncharacterized protein n=1 Tax=Owenia fusiformis TaxID=6347 RepID=A0A8J1U4D9_OWEFU|nr:unnamed protein product [Owenia fusiformis]
MAGIKGVFMTCFFIYSFIHVLLARPQESKSSESAFENSENDPVNRLGEKRPKRAAWNNYKTNIHERSKITTNEVDYAEYGADYDTDEILDELMTNEVEPDINIQFKKFTGQKTFHRDHRFDKKQLNEIREAPQYMLDLYHEYLGNRKSQPTSDIVRSFMNVNGDPYKITDSSTHGNKTRVHSLIFNITSLKQDETIQVAELRLYKLVEVDRNHYSGHNRKVSVFEVILPEDSNASERQHILISCKNIYGRHSGWETFTVTQAVSRWHLRKSSFQRLEVRIESVFDLGHTHGDIDIDTRPRQRNEPLLVVFSNEGNYESESKRELDEMMIHGLSKRRTGTSHSHKSRTGNSMKLGRSETYVPPYRYPPILRHYNLTTSASYQRRVKRSRKRSRKNTCKRKPLVVNFQDINWHTWVIAPRSYDVGALPTIVSTLDVLTSF